jgi:hypothetical protein
MTLCGGYYLVQRVIDAAGKTSQKRYKKMSDKIDLKNDPNKPMVYQIRIKGQLDPQWTSWFEGLTITLEEGGDTHLTGTVVDQAALHGLLKKVRDLGLPLVSVSPVEPGPSTSLGTGQADVSDVKS